MLGWTAKVKAAETASVVKIRIWTGVFWLPNIGEDIIIAEHRTKTIAKENRKTASKLIGQPLPRARCKDA